MTDTVKGEQGSAPPDPSGAVRTQAGAWTRRLATLLVWLWVAFNVFLLLWILISSLKTSGEIFSRETAMSLPDIPQWGNYVSAWAVQDFGRAFLNTVSVVFSAALVVVALAAPAAYALSRSGVASANAMTTFFAVGVGIPLQAVLVPLFVMTNALGLADSLVGLSIVYTAVSLPFTVFLLTGFFRSLPGEIEEAAALDGASGFRTFLGVMLPLARPGLITAFTLNVVLLWNETLLVLVLITDNSQYTLSRSLLGLYSAMQYTGDWGGLFAGSVIVGAPVLIIYFWLGRRILEGMTLGVGK